MRDEGLWHRVAAHALDAPGVEEPLSVKLAQAEGWTPDFTQRVIEEYRRFLYLACISETQATPSEVIDRAWHMHLTFSRDYWDVLCADVLGRTLHHEPCSGPSERPRYAEQYFATCAFYREEFGEDPPQDIWGASVRGVKAKVSVWLRVCGFALLAGAAIASLVARMDGLAAVLGVVAMGALAVGYLIAPNRWRGTGGNGSGPAGCAGCGGGCGGG